MRPKYLHVENDLHEMTRVNAYQIDSFWWNIFPFIFWET